MARRNSRGGVRDEARARHRSVPGMWHVELHLPRTRVGATRAIVHDVHPFVIDQSASSLRFESRIRGFQTEPIDAPEMEFQSTATRLGSTVGDGRASRCFVAMRVALASVRPNASMELSLTSRVAKSPLARPPRPASCRRATPRSVTHRSRDRCRARSAPCAHRELGRRHPRRVRARATRAETPSRARRPFGGV